VGQGPFAKSPGAIGVAINRRRSTRIEHICPIAISGRDATGRPFREETETIMVSAHGANFRSRSRVLIGMQLTVENLLDGSSEKAICIRVTPAESPEDRQVLAIQLVTPRNIWGMKDPPADWQLALITNPSAPPPPEIINLAGGSSTRALKPDAASEPALERRAAEVTQAALQDLRRQAALIMQDSLREFESCLKSLEAAAEARMVERSEITSHDTEKSLDHLLYQFLEQLTERTNQMAAESEDDLRHKLAELFAPLLKMASGGNSGREGDAEIKK